MKAEDVFLPINEAINYFTQRNPAVLKTLQSRFPEFGDLLQPGLMMGQEDGGQIGRSAFVADLLAAALTEAQADVDQKLNLARQTILRANTYQSWAQYLALLMSGSTLGLIGFEMQVAAQVTSVGAVGGSPLALASERILAVVDPAAGSYRSVFIKLVGLAEKVSALRREALIYVKFPGSEEALAAFSGQANALCLEVRELGAQI
ncbi:hypothetical protein [Massilia scottii]|uniref:hypothetical protein n=1 Tax=Massilia scottii TaxID=3057166 RepID=UPI002796BC2A|nr:hypothetical protein [Massilia sp. CCM 9029]MDQ1833768.1 hypothetical protein [Massilia sp. CCM 9029]